MWIFAPNSYPPLFFMVIIMITKWIRAHTRKKLFLVLNSLYPDYEVIFVSKRILRRFGRAKRHYYYKVKLRKIPKVAKIKVTKTTIRLSYESKRSGHDIQLIGAFCREIKNEDDKQKFIQEIYDLVTIYFNPDIANMLVIGVEEKPKFKYKKGIATVHTTQKEKPCGKLFNRGYLKNNYSHFKFKYINGGWHEEN